MKEKVFETVQGYRLIGVEVKPTDEFYLKRFGMPKALAEQAFHGIWVHRTRISKITFLAQEEIVRTRPITILDTEFDPPLGLGVER